MQKKIENIIYISKIEGCHSNNLKALFQKYANYSKIKLYFLSISSERPDVFFEILSKYTDKPNTLIFFEFPILGEISYAQIVELRKDSFIGAYFADSSQYFEDSFRFVVSYLDFVLVSEPSEEWRFKNYIESVFWHPQIVLTSQNYPLKINNNREKDVIHIGMIQHRSGREFLKTINDSRIIDLYGKDTKNGFINYDDYFSQLSRYKIGVVYTSAGVSKFGFPDPYLKYFKQLKGKIWDYFFAGNIVLTEYAPGLSEYAPDSYIIFHDNDDLIKKIKLILNNKSLQKKYFLASKKIRSQYSFENFAEKFDDFLNSLRKKNYKPNMSEASYDRNAKNELASSPSTYLKLRCKSGRLKCLLSLKNIFSKYLIFFILRKVKQLLRS